MQAAQEQGRLFDALSVFLLTLAETRPLVLCFDDAQRSDRSSLALVASLAHSLARARVLFLSAYRGAETSDDLENVIQTVSRAGTLTRVTVPRLARDEVMELTNALSHSECAPCAEWLYRTIEGNPFFIRELMAYLQTTAAPRDWEKSKQVLPAAPLPSSIQDLVRARLKRLSERARTSVCRRHYRPRF